MHRGALASIFVYCIILVGAPDRVWAEEADAGSVGGCVESIPKGAVRPELTETFPTRGTSGWAATLSITVRHGKGERVLPSGLDLTSAADAKNYLRKAGFIVPDQDGGAGAVLWSEPDDPTRTTTHLELPLVTLPDSPGRNVMSLPPLPVAVARANGEIATVCTGVHSILVEDPIANTPNAEPKPNPPPRPQREEWTAMKKAVIWGSLGVLVGAILAYLIYRWRKRPKPVPAPPPPRPPWEIALEKLDEVRCAGLLDAGRYAEYFDRVSDAVRGYLGARFGFDGLESTTDEILTALKKHTGDAQDVPLAGGISLVEIRHFLAECDLVKFANLTPTQDQCAFALTNGEHIVRATSPSVAPGVTVTPPPAQQAEAPVANDPTDVEKYGPPTDGGPS